MSVDRNPILAVIGPSGSGKSTVVRRLAELGIVTVHPTWTTRPRRADEVDGSLEHRFVSERAFDSLDRAGFFAGAIELFGLPFRYGLPHIDRSGGASVDAVMLRAPVVARFTEVFGAPLVYQVEAALDAAAARVASRASGAADLAARLDDNRRELVAGRALAHRVFVNDGSIEPLVAEVAAALATDLGREVAA
jgi:guanylate kinase